MQNVAKMAKQSRDVRDERVFMRTECEGGVGR
jgi:hypothetical protein